MPIWYVYLLRCCDNSLYVGISTDVNRRLRQHNSGHGAKYAQLKGPVHLAWREPMRDRSAAMRRAAAIKRLPRHAKEQLILGDADPAAIRNMVLGKESANPTGRRSDDDLRDALSPAEQDRW